MRDFLDDIQANMDAGIGRAQQHARKELPKRFYKKVSVENSGNGFGVALDGRLCKTPGRILVEVPSADLAQLLAVEWEAQQDHIDARGMPIVRLVNSAVEGGKAAEAALRDEVVSFANNDLLLYRAQSPKDLIEMQSEHWDEVLGLIEKHFSVIFEPVTGIIHRPQPKESLQAIKNDLQTADFIAATCLVSITGITGSGLLAIALRHQLLSSDSVWRAALIDEEFNAKHWGKDPEAVSRLEKRRTEFDSAIKVLGLVDKI